MSLIPNFTASQATGSPSEIILTDTSSGSDVAVVSKRVYFSDCYGNFLVETGTSTEYEVWTTNPQTFDVLTKDYAVKITVQWLDINGDVLYDKSLNFGFSQYNEDFDYQLTTLMASNPLLIQDNSFYEEKSNLRTFIDAGDKAVTRVSDIYAAQLCYDQATNLRLNSQYYFNANS